QLPNFSKIRFSWRVSNNGKSNKLIEVRRSSLRFQAVSIRHDSFWPKPEQPCYFNRRSCLTPLAPALALLALLNAAPFGGRHILHRQVREPISAVRFSIHARVREKQSAVDLIARRSDG